jgi:hypothetical protein
MASSQPLCTMHLLSLAAENALDVIIFFSIIFFIDRVAFRAFGVSWIQTQHPEISRDIDIDKQIDKQMTRRIYINTRFNNSLRGIH